ncbi:MAG: hypothetical protein ACK4X1_14365 [Terricaulis sp.]
MSCGKTEIVRAGGDRLVVVPDPTQPIAVVSGGQRGPAGAPGGAEFSRKAAQALGGHRVVRALANDEVDYASSDEIAHAALIVGVTMGAASAGAAILVRGGGELQDDSWSWSLGAVFCGLNGVLTQTPPASGFIRQIGIADAPDRIIIDLRPPIML